MWCANGDVGLVQLPRHLLSLSRAALFELGHLEDKIEVLLGVLLLQEGTEKCCAILKGNAFVLKKVL